MGLTVAVFLAGLVVFAVLRRRTSAPAAIRRWRPRWRPWELPNTQWRTSAAVQVERPPLRERRRGVRPRPTEWERLVAPAAGPTSEPGISYTNIIIPAVPWSVHVLKIERTRPDLTFYTALAQDKVLGVSLIRDQARAVPAEFGRAIAGVNGDFYDRDNPTYAGDPRGLQIVRGELVSAPDTVAVWFDPRAIPTSMPSAAPRMSPGPMGKVPPFGMNQRPRPSAPTSTPPPTAPPPASAASAKSSSKNPATAPGSPSAPAKPTAPACAPCVSRRQHPPQPRHHRPLRAPRPRRHRAHREPWCDRPTLHRHHPDLRGVQMAIAGGPAIIEKGKPFPHHTAPPG